MAENTPLRNETDAERAVITLAEEFVTIDKRLEETGTVRIHKTTTERPETVHVETRHERVSVERVPIDRIVDGPVEIRQEGDTTVIPVLEEVLVVEKRLMLREEVRVTRIATDVPEERTVVLRKEEAVVERVGPEPMSE